MKPLSALGVLSLDRAPGLRPSATFTAPSVGLAGEEALAADQNGRHC